MNADKLNVGPNHYGVESAESHLMIFINLHKFIKYFGLLGCAFVSAAQAELIETRLANGIPVAAEFRAGKPHQPGIIVVHGFLQTRDFPTVARLVDGLAVAGYTVLAPTLSLGVPRRNRSLACEAAHLHSMEQDVAEIGFWVDWLTQKRPGSIVLIGHSYGSLQNLMYANGKPAPHVNKLIALSLVDAEYQADIHNMQKMRAEAKKKINAGDKSLGAYSLSYCKKYVSSPSAYLSYARIDRAQIKKLAKESKINLDVIMGSEDDRMGKDWPELLRAAGNRVHTIEGANHFFDAEYEFDVLDLSISLIKGMHKK